MPYLHTRCSAACQVEATLRAALWQHVRGLVANTAGGACDGHLTCMSMSELAWGLRLCAGVRARLARAEGADRENHARPGPHHAHVWRRHKRRGRPQSCTRGRCPPVCDRDSGELAWLAEKREGELLRAIHALAGMRRIPLHPCACLTVLHPVIRRCAHSSPRRRRTRMKRHSLQQAARSLPSGRRRRRRRRRLQRRSGWTFQLCPA